MEQDFELKLINEYRNDGTLNLDWYIIVKFDNGESIKVLYNDGPGRKDINNEIRKYKLKKRKEKINKIKCRTN